MEHTRPNFAEEQVLPGQACTFLMQPAFMEDVDEDDAIYLDADSNEAADGNFPVQAVLKPSMEEVEEHINKMSDRQTEEHKCPICGLTIRNSNNLEVHIASHESSQEKRQVIFGKRSRKGAPPAAWVRKMQHKGDKAGARVSSPPSHLHDHCISYCTPVVVTNPRNTLVPRLQNAPSALPSLRLCNCWCGTTSAATTTLVHIPAIIVGRLSRQPQTELITNASAW